MASIPIQITGVLTYTGLEIGGGPMPGGPSVMPPIAYPPPGGSGQPPGIWHDPGGYRPPGIWGGPIRPGDPSWGGQPPGIWHDPGGYRPPEIWGGPGSLPPQAMLPIVIPPEQQPPGGSGNTPMQPIYIPGTSGPGGTPKLLVAAGVPGSGQGVTWFLVEIPPPPTQPGPKK